MSELPKSYLVDKLYRARVASLAAGYQIWWIPELHLVVNIFETRVASNCSSEIVEAVASNVHSCPRM